jgi:hypothetical protein
LPFNHARAIRAVMFHLVGLRIYCQNENYAKADARDQNVCVLSRHSGMPLAGIHSGALLDSGQNRAGMTER